MSTICGQVLTITSVPGGGVAVTVFDPGPPPRLEIFGPNIDPAHVATFTDAMLSGRDVCVTWDPANPGVPISVVIQP